MVLFRDQESLADAIGVVRRQLNNLDATFIEKDYWVTQVIRSVQQETDGGFVLKGGTSLSKGYGIIKRFSEDVDVLIVPEASVSITRRAKRLAAVRDSVAVQLGLPTEEQRKPGYGNRASRGDYFVYDPVVKPEIQLEVLIDRVLLETGYGEGHEPSEMVTISTLLGQLETVDENAYDDLRPFTVRALNPVRTLIEKLCALHHEAMNFDPEHPSEERFGRHYFDVNELLLHESTRKQLQDRPAFHRLVEEVVRISHEHYGGSTTRPATGFADSPAFAPTSDEMRLWLERRFGAARTLFPPGMRTPTFTSVLTFVQQQKSLL